MNLARLRRPWLLVVIVKSIAWMLASIVVVWLFTAAIGLRFVVSTHTEDAFSLRLRGASLEDLYATTSMTSEEVAVYADFNATTRVISDYWILIGTNHDGPYQVVLQVHNPAQNIRDVRIDRVMLRAVQRAHEARERVVVFEGSGVRGINEWRELVRVDSRSYFRYVASFPIGKPVSLPHGDAPLEILVEFSVRMNDGNVIQRKWRGDVEYRYIERVSFGPLIE